MTGWEEELKQIIRGLLMSGGDLVIIGVGNLLRGDDGVGVELAKILRQLLKSERVKVLIIEDRVDLIPRALKNMNPGLILFLDAADFGGRSGEIRLMKLEDALGKAVSTHELPLNLLLKVAEISAPAYVLGIQVETLEFGRGISPAVKAAADEAASLLLNLLMGL